MATDEELNLYLSGLASGIGTVLMGQGVPQDQAAHSARNHVRWLLEDPAVRLEVERTVEGIKAGATDHKFIPRAPVP